MTSKEALECIIWRLTSHEEDLELRETDKKEIEIIKQDLERLEALEKENKELWENIEKYNHKFAEVERKKADLMQQNEKLKKAIEIIIREKIKPSAFLGILKDYKYHNKVDIPYEKVSIYLDCELSQQEYELLKEVLCE